MHSKRCATITPFGVLVTKLSLLPPDLPQTRRGERASSDHDASRRGQSLLSYPRPSCSRTTGRSAKAEIPGEHLHLTFWACECYSNDIPLLRTGGRLTIPAQIEDYTQQASSSTPQTPTAFVDGMTTFAPFYHSQSYVRPSLGAHGHVPLWFVCRADVDFVTQNDSADSLSSESSLDDDAARRAESEHVTQVHRIAGRVSLPRSVGGMLQRTLSRPNCMSPRAADTNVVIGVVVEENHVEELEPREATPRPASRAKAYVHAPCTLRPQSSRMTIPGAGTRDATGNWRSKAQDLFKRKTRPRGSSLWTVTPTQQM